MDIALTKYVVVVFDDRVQLHHFVCHLPTTLIKAWEINDTNEFSLDLLNRLAQNHHHEHHVDLLSEK